MRTDCQTDNMVSSIASARKESIEMRSAAGFFAIVFSLLALGLLGHRTTSRAYAVWSASMQIAWWLSIGVGIAGATLMVAAFLRASDKSRQFWMPLLSSVGVLIVGGVIGEVGVRAIARRDPNGVRVGRAPLLPYDWRGIAADNRRKLERFRSSRAPYYFVEDTLLGWSIGANRASADGMYRSRSDGIRTAQAGETLSRNGDRPRIALIGDSFTFSMEVPFDEAWSHYLAESLTGYQVLNFGVDGYGVDQTLLRFERDVSKWSPSIVVFSIIQDDLYRSASVYPFLRGWNYPVSRPRFALRDDTLVLRNSPVLSGDSIFATSNVFDLPLIDLDVFFDETRWRRRALDRSYLARLALTVFAPWPAPRESTSDDAVLELNLRLLGRFVADARALGATPIIVYLPSRNDFATHEPLLKTRFDPLLRAHGIVMHDLTDCLTSRVPPPHLFLEGRVHYDGSGNAAVAACMRTLLPAQPGA